jgi:hypothetical protein
MIGKICKHPTASVVALYADGSPLLSTRINALTSSSYDEANDASCVESSTMVFAVSRMFIGGWNVIAPTSAKIFFMLALF